MLTYLGEPPRKGIWQSENSRIAFERKVLMIDKRYQPSGMHSEEFFGKCIDLFTAYRVGRHLRCEDHTFVHVMNASNPELNLAH